jgi:ketopantoate reductase
VFVAQRTALLVSLFERAGVGGAETIDDLIAERWAKLSVNCYVNALGGLSGMGSSTMRRYAIISSQKLLVPYFVCR